MNVSCNYLSQSVLSVLAFTAFFFSPSVLYAAAECHDHGAPSVSLQLGAPDPEGWTPFTATYVFQHPPSDYSQRVEIFVNGISVNSQGNAAQSGTLEGSLSLGCVSPPAEIKTVRAMVTEGADCPQGQDVKTVALDTTPQGAFTVTGPDIDGIVQFHIEYVFPYTDDGNDPSARSVNFQIKDPAGNVFDYQNYYWQPLSGSLNVLYDFACNKPGTWTATANLNGCIDVPLQGSFTVDSTPSIDVQATEVGSTHRIDVQYDFPNSNSSASRRLWRRVFDADGVLRSDQFVHAAARTGTWSVTLDTSCWPDGPARVDVAASCGFSRLAEEQEFFTIRNQPRVDVSVKDDPATGPTATVTWDFPRGPGNVQVVLIEPSGAEEGLASFTPETLTGSRQIPFTTTGGARTVTILARANGAQACQYAVDTASYDCTCRAVGDPVDLADGNMRYSDSDPLPGGGAFAFSRVYDSRHEPAGHFGKGWTSALDARITLNRPYSVTVVTETNEPHVFVEKGAVGGTFEQRWPRSSSRGRLTYNAAAQTYVFTPASGRPRRVYSAVTGRLAEIRDPATDRAILFAYDSTGLPASVTDSWGAWAWSITTDATTRLVTSIAVDGHPNLTWSYSYDLDKRLTQVLAPGALAWRTYTYVSGGMTEAHDASGHLIESHDYDANGWAISSYGPSGEISSIQYALPGSTPGETITRVTHASGAVTDYRMRVAGGTPRPVQVEGGCASCGGGEETTTVYDAFGLVEREQNAAGYIASSTYDPRTHRLLTRTAHQRPTGCDPETDPARCRLNVDALRDANLVATSATITVAYTYGDPNWPEKATNVRTPSVAVAGTFRDETVTHHSVTGDVLVRTTSGYAGNAPAQASRGSITTLYENAPGQTNGLMPAFDPGGVFLPAWTSLPQPMYLTRSIDGPRSDVQDVTSFVHYPTDSSVPPLLRGKPAATKNAAGHITRFESYDVFGNVTRAVDPNGVATQMTYDVLGRLLTSTLKGVPGCDTVVDPLCATDPTTTLTYTSTTGHLSGQEKPGGGTTSYTYDSRGRMLTHSRGPSAADLRERIEYHYHPLSGRKDLEKILGFQNGQWWKRSARPMPTPRRDFSRR